MKLVMFLIGLLVVFVLAFLVSSDRKKIKYKPIAIMLVIQLALSYFLLNTKIGYVLVKGIADGFGAILKYAEEGVNFVFGGLANDGQAPFFLTVLLPIIFLAVLIGILQHIKILPIIIRAVGFVLSKINGLGKLESYNAVAAAIVGQGEVFITVKDQLSKLPKNRLYTLCASSMSTVSMSIVGSYMKMIEPKYVVTALVLNLFSGFIIVHIINPYDVKEEDDILELQEDKKQTFFEMLGEYIMLGFSIAVTVAAMLIGFVALITAINGVFDSIFGITFQSILGYIFSPLAFIMGIPTSEMLTAGQIMATKLVTNEFVAMLDLGKVAGDLSDRTVGILSIFLVSFANFSSIGIIAGATKSIDGKQANVVSSFGLKLVYGATLVSILSAVIVGVML
ncbi:MULTISPECIES: NupC/NupG family nucleoside CNT transporter [Bacillus cereus group]|uniref:Na dependent nucleoside transporter domain protein n=3 Tax=Bacillus cytotoxicus TaxID=580165 RepID=A7GUM9_BACCN|nr:MULTISPECIES: nucleoside transporter C-terminal domain-containing protein [Bacillus cereus group]ABS23837.1 Na dependent nucleoside transporter domain protein [Bacillus cytotoxicus NVH 391-98]AWC46441.1 pyrimidine nucleoside transporter NupC [Bacillus cytotoxicus]MDH2865164.1 pyrimidine nucleoside transporter NupC [Bacillus cytotoxicus]MDH2884958.1 pyrimidine nucleoside transporter NupC [Bacillus cytotoxicus]MDH2888539.1 pyrimidine nucleoside transporter NupC [Bacillus cytotoxicus]